MAAAGVLFSGINRYSEQHRLKCTALKILCLELNVTSGLIAWTSACSGEFRIYRGGGATLCFANFPEKLNQIEKNLQEGFSQKLE